MFDEIVDAKPVGPFGVGWNGIMPYSQEQNDNDTPDYEHVSEGLCLQVCQILVWTTLK